MATPHSTWESRLAGEDPPPPELLRWRLRRPESLWEMILLADDDLPEERALLEAGRRLGIDLGTPHGLLLVVPDGARAWEPDRAAAALAALAPGGHPVTPPGRGTDHRLVLLPAADRETWRALLRRAEAPARRFRAQILAVEPAAPAELRETCREASSALPTLRHLGGGAPVLELSRLRLGLFLAQLGREQRRALYRAPLRELLDQPAADRWRDLTTIRAWHTAGGETKLAARALGVHPRSVLRRLAGIRERIGAAPESGEVYVAAMSYLLDHPWPEQEERRSPGIWVLWPALAAARHLARLGNHVRQAVHQSEPITNLDAGRQTMVAAIALALGLLVGVTPAAPIRGVPRTVGGGLPAVTAPAVSTAAAAGHLPTSVALVSKASLPIDPRPGSGGGASASPTPEGTRFFSATPSPSYDRDHTVVATGRDGRDLVLFRSTDGGASWTSAAGPAPPAAAPQSLALSGDLGAVNANVVLPPSYPDDPILFLHVYWSEGIDLAYVSAGFGEPWKMLPLPPGPLTVSPRFETTHTIYVASWGDVFKYTLSDGPAVPVVHNGDALAMPWSEDPIMPATIVPAPGSSDGDVLIYASTRAIPLHPPKPSIPDLQPSTTTSINGAFYGVGSLIACSDDLVGTCRLVSRPGMEYDIFAGSALTASPTFGMDHVVAATTIWPDRMAISNDGGHSFRLMDLPRGSESIAAVSSPDAAPVLWLTMHVREGWKLGRTSATAAASSSASAAAWTLVRQRLPVSKQVNFVPLSPTRLLMFDTRYDERGLFCSPDAGATWYRRCPAEQG